MIRDRVVEGTIKRLSGSNKGEDSGVLTTRDMNVVERKIGTVLTKEEQ